MSTELADFDDDGPANGEGTVLSGDSERKEIAGRLKSILQIVNADEVASVSGVSKRTVSRVLAGDRVKQSTYVALSHAMGVRPDWLVHGTGDMRTAGLSQSQSQSQHQSHSTDPINAVILDVLQDLSGQQKEAMRSCIVLALNAFEAAKRQPLPLMVSETALDFFEQMCGAGEGHRARVRALERAVEEFLEASAKRSTRTEGPA